MDVLWDVITDFVIRNPKQSLLSPAQKSQQFHIRIDGDNLILLFLTTRKKLKLEKNRFESAYRMLTEHRGEWVKIGGSRVDTKPDTLEGSIKNDFDGKMNGLSTAPWVAAILVGAFNYIVFNRQMRGQAINMLKVNPEKIYKHNRFYETEENEHEDEYGNFFKADEIVCPYCGEILFGLNKCDHIIFVWDGTNGEYNDIQPGFKKYLIKKIKYCPDLWELDEEYVSECQDKLDGEGHDNFWLIEVGPKPGSDKFQDLFSDIEYYEFCDTDQRSYYNGVTFGICSDKGRKKYTLR